MSTASSPVSEGKKTTAVSLLNNLRSTVTHVLNLHDVEIYKTTCIIYAGQNGRLEPE